MDKQVASLIHEMTGVKTGEIASKSRTPLTRALRALRCAVCNSARTNNAQTNLAYVFILTYFAAQGGDDHQPLGVSNRIARGGRVAPDHPGRTSTRAQTARCRHKQRCLAGLLYAKDGTTANRKE